MAFAVDIPDCVCLFWERSQTLNEELSAPFLGALTDALETCDARRR
jgi:hypothetical protein